MCGWGLGGVFSLQSGYFNGSRFENRLYPSCEAIQGFQLADVQGVSQAFAFLPERLSWKKKKKKKKMKGGFSLIKSGEKKNCNDLDTDTATFFFSLKCGKRVPHNDALRLIETIHSSYFN